MLAEVTLDLSAVGSTLKYLLAAVIGFAGIVLLFGPTIMSKIRSVPTPTPPGTPPDNIADLAARLRENGAVSDKLKPGKQSSDKLPPEGFVEHLKIIQSAAPNANPVVWWEYALQGMTFAIASHEEAKLARTTKAVAKESAVTTEESEAK